MGKGDRKSQKGKIWRGTNGKRRPKSSVLKKAKKKIDAEKIKSLLFQQAKLATH